MDSRTITLPAPKAEPGARVNAIDSRSGKSKPGIVDTVAYRLNQRAWFYTVTLDGPEVEIYKRRRVTVGNEGLEIA